MVSALTPFESICSRRQLISDLPAIKKGSMWNQLNVEIECWSVTIELTYRSISCGKVWLLVIRCSHIGAFFGFGHMPVYRISVSIRQFSTGLKAQIFYERIRTHKNTALIWKICWKKYHFLYFLIETGRTSLQNVSSRIRNDALKLT